MLQQRTNKKETNPIIGKVAHTKLVFVFGDRIDLEVKKG